MLWRRSCPPARVLSREFTLDISGRGNRRIRDHVGVCPACAAEWRALERLRELARGLPAAGASPAELEGVRTVLLVDSRPARAGRGKPLLWVLISAVAAAVALASLHPRARKVGASSTGRPGAVARPTSTRGERRGTVHPNSGAVFATLGGQPDEVVRLRDGSIGVEVEPLAEHERFRVVTGDAEVEVRGTSFVVAAVGDRLRDVSVVHGRVVVRPHGGEAATLGSGQRWTAAEPAPAPAPERPVARGAATRPVARRKQALGPAAAKAVAGRTSLATPALSAAEIAFADGWQALRSQRFSQAASAFARASAAAGGAPLAEDAWFWKAVCEARVPRPAEARASLAAFIERFPRSPRVGEASAMLGWILLDGGRLDEAARQFTFAARDPSDEVRQSAQAGLEQVAARRSDAGGPDGGGVPRPATPVGPHRALIP
jgi:TolA-binding protein